VSPAEKYFSRGRALTDVTGPGESSKSMSVSAFVGGRIAFRAKHPRYDLKTPTFRNLAALAHQGTSIGHRLREILPAPGQNEKPAPKALSLKLLIQQELV
jgi:hypothetical protein